MFNFAVQAVHVLSALRMVRAPGGVYRALATAPRFVAWKVRTVAARIVRANGRRMDQDGTEPAMTTHRMASVLGVPVDDVTMDEALDRVTAMVERGRTSGRVHKIATVNVDFICQCRPGRSG